MFSLPLVIYSPLIPHTDNTLNRLTCADSITNTKNIWGDFVLLTCFFADLLLVACSLSQLQITEALFVSTEANILQHNVTLP